MATNKKSYIGITNDLANRLKCHNGYLDNGAKATRTGEGWYYHTVVGGFKDKSEAARFEWRWKWSQCKRKKNKKGTLAWARTRKDGKFKRLVELLLQDEWTHIMMVI
jgi:predicted GIY-YIG superfamily endonuclease